MAPRKLVWLSNWATRGTPIRHHMATRAWATRFGLVTVRISLAAVWVPTSMQLRAWNSTAPARWRGPTMSTWWEVPGSGARRLGYGTPLGTYRGWRRRGR